MRVLVVKDYESLSRRAEVHVVRALRQKPRLLLGVATGASPAGLYERLAKRAQPSLFRRITVVGLDEWLGLPPRHGGSCQRYIHERILRPLGIPRSRYQGFRADREDRAAETRRMARWLDREGPLDLAILGLGRNGHLLMNEPADGPSAAPSRGAAGPEHALPYDDPGVGGPAPRGLDPGDGRHPPVSGDPAPGLRARQAGGAHARACRPGVGPLPGLVPLAPSRGHDRLRSRGRAAAEARPKVVNEALRALALDIGGTKIAVAMVGEDGEMLRETSFPTESARGFASGVARIREAAASLLGESGGSAVRLAGIGVGCAGPVDPVKGTIHNPFTLPGWEDGNIVAALREAFSCPVALENDADAALLGEAWRGAGRGKDPVLLLTFGTGIGGAALVSGALLRGMAGAHPELGHVIADPSGPSCYCGARGCFESLASGTALNAAAQQGGFGDGRRLLARAAAGDAAADGLRARALAATANAVWTLLHTLLPERIILGGGMMDEHYEPFAEAVRGAIGRAAALPGRGVSVARAELGNRAGLVGAARMVFERLRREPRAPH